MKSFKVFFVLTALALPALIMGCPFGNNGITMNSINQINVDGFDADDQNCDDNDYAYGMTWFTPSENDTKSPAEGTMYVGTGNNVAGLVGAYIQILLGGGSISDALLPCLPIRIAATWLLS